MADLTYNGVHVRLVVIYSGVCMPDSVEASSCLETQG